MGLDDDDDDDDDDDVVGGIKVTSERGSGKGAPAHQSLDTDIQDNDIQDNISINVVGQPVVAWRSH